MSNLVHIKKFRRRSGLTETTREMRRQLASDGEAEHAENERALGESERPRTRGDCVDGPLPCPWVSCRHHLYLDVNPQTGHIRLNFPGVDVADMQETCSLDIADRVAADGGELGYRDLAPLLNMSFQAAEVSVLRVSERIRAARKRPIEP